ncbi:Aspartic proteinase nepenthesin-1-like protein [Drosera capensis]
MASLLYFFFAIVYVFAVQTRSISGRDFLHNHDLRNNWLGFRTTIKHIDAGKNLTRSEHIKRAVEQGNRRLETLKSRLTGAISGASFSVQLGGGEYLMNLGRETPPTYYSAVIDTGTDLIWTQCLPCQNCYALRTPIFNPANSSSYSHISCDNEFCYALPWPICDAYGYCSYINTYGGIVGLGRGALSLSSQLEEPRFSYCLAPILGSEPS